LLVLLKSAAGDYCVKKLALVAFLVIFCHWVVIAQTAPNLENGWKPYGSYDGTHLDTVNLMNGNLMLHAPLVPVSSQRGSIKVNNTLYLTSKDWQVVCTTPSGSGPSCSWKKGGTGISIQVTPALSVHRTLNKSFGGADGTTVQEAYGYSLITPDQGSHSLHGVAGTEDSNLEPTQFDSTDLSGYHVALSNPDVNYGVFSHVIVTDRNGTRYEGDFTVTSGCGKAPQGLLTSSPDGIQLTVDDVPYGDQYCSETAYVTLVTDSNGNQVSLRAPGHPVAGVDTLGKAIFPAVTSITTDFSGCVSSHVITGAMIYSYQDPNGITQNIKFCQAEVPIQTAFNANNGSGGLVQEAATGVNGLDFQPIVTVILSDKTVWTFDYDSYGEVTSIGLPTGGSIQYMWRTVSSLNCNDGALTQYSRAIASRTLIDAQGNSAIWNYNWGTATSSSLTNIVTDPAGNDTVHVFSDLNPLAGLGPACKFFETSTIQYQGPQSAGKPLQRTDTAYSAANIAIDDSGGVSGYGLGNVFATDITTTVYPSNKVKKVHRDPDPGLGTGFPSFGNVVKELEYDWGQGAPGALLRETDTVYQWQKSSAYLTAHLLDLPSSKVVVSPSTNPRSGCPISATATSSCMAETDFVYDEAPYLTVPQPAITMQHVAPPNGLRGNLTTTNSWLSTTNSFISSHTDWYDTGEPYQKTDPLGHTTTLSYDPAYAGGYVTQTCSPSTNGVAHCVSGVYDFTTGVLKSFTDQNGQTSNFAYDYMFHISSAQGPADAANGNLRSTNTFTYSDITAPNTFPLTVTRQKSVTTTLTDSVTSTYDGLGRSTVTQHAMPSGSPSTVTTLYDDSHDKVTVSNPFFSTADSTYGNTAMLSDALGRPQIVTEQDGSVKSVNYDVVPLAGALGNCNLTVDEVFNERRSCSDALGRLVEVDEPNPGSTPTYAQAAVIISGIEQATPQAGSPGTGYVDIGGAEASSQTCTDPEPPALPRCTTVPDTGSVSIQVGSYPAKSASFGTGSTAAAVAGALALAFHNDPSSPVDASISPSSSVRILFTARSVGVATDYSFTVSPLQATAPDFWGTPSGAALINGRDATSNPDTGTATVTVNGTSYQISYGGGDTAASLATRLATAISAGAWANASTSGGTITITAKNPGPGGDYSLSAPPTTFDSLHFPGPSFSVSSQASALSGGYNSGDVDNQPLRTLYSYDALGNLLCVEQHGNVSGTGCSASPGSDASSPWRVRRFTYDSLSRLLTAHNPESGTISYAYDADGNVLQKTSPAPNQTGSATQTISYCYDALHRVTGKVYSAQTCPLASPVVTYTYDVGSNAKGKLTSLTDQAGSASYNYDPLGRMTSETRVIAGVPKSISYEYYLGGSLAKLHYPSGRVITYTPDSAGRIISAADSNGTQYVTSATYYANGSEFQRSYPGIYFSTTLNPRLQVAAFYSDNGVVSSYFMNKTYSYGAPHQNNGNISSIVDNKDSSRTQTFTYDLLNRITSGYSAASTGTFSWGETYSVDAWGNLNIAPMGGKAHGGTFANASDNNNRPLGFTFDAAGNLTNTSQYVYDPENRIQVTAGTAYTYDADGQRVLKSNSSTGAALKRYWVGNGNILAEADGSGNLTAEYIYFNGKRIARIDLPANSVHYYLSDHLGSSTKIINASGVVEEESDFTSYGSELSATAGVNHYKFTSKERDSETGLDYFGARYYSNLMGRFMTPDWAAKAEPVPYAKLINPQSLNLYSYVMNNPLTLRDEDGHEDTSAQKGQKIAAAAKAQDGSHSYDIKNVNVSNMQIFKPGSDKCNEFVADTVKSADGTRPVVDSTGKIPTAAQFANSNVKITGLSAPEPLANAKPGDVIAQDHGPNAKTGNEEGHVGIVVSVPHDGQPGQTASANANLGGQVTVNDWGFRSTTANPNNGERHGADSPPPVVRHPLGGL
jgi:RHS repeat-associated protein